MHIATTIDQRVHLEAVTDGWRTTWAACQTQPEQHQQAGSGVDHECSASENIDALPVTAAAMNFVTAIATFAAVAAYSVNLRRSRRARTKQFRAVGAI